MEGLNLMQRYGNFGGFALAIVNCLGWYPTMTHVFSSSAKTLFFDALMN